MWMFDHDEYDIKSRSCGFLNILILLLVFAGPVINTFLFIINKKSASGQMAIVYLIVAAGAMILAFLYSDKYMPSGILFIIPFTLLISGAFFVTQRIYGAGNAQFVSEQRAFLAIAPCSMIISFNIIWLEAKKINSVILAVFDLVLSLVSFIVLIQGDSLTAGGLIADSSGFMYQNISYYAAYCLGMNMFLMAENKQKIHSVLQRTIFLLMSLLQIITCFMSGGRGGAVLAVVFLAYGLFSMYGIKKAFRIIIPLFLSVMIGIFFFSHMIGKLEINSKGLARVVGMFSDFAGNKLSDLGRYNLQKSAIDAFLRHPVLGNGIGSVFYLIGSYSHNLFTDILCETGIIGFIAFFIVLANAIRRACKLYRTGSLYRFMVIVFISGITLNLFSGYIWANQQVWLPVAVFSLTPIPETEPDTL